MLHVPDVRLPRKVLRVLRTANDETPVGRSTCDLKEQSVEQLLAIESVSSEIREVRLIGRACRSGMVNVRIDAAEQRRNATGAKLIAQGSERRAARVAQHQIEVGELPRTDIGKWFAVL